MSTSTAVVTKQTLASVSLKQSQKLVSTLLIMSFGCITYLRGLFDESCFNDKKYYPNRDTVDNHGSSQNAIRVKTLLRGKSDKVDTLLDWLEKGVFPLIAQKYLKALSFSIYVDELNPLDLLESYTFSFDYVNNQVQMDIGDGDNGKGATSNPFSMLDTRKAIQRLMRRLIILTQSLPSLPAKRNLSIRLLFNDSCPLDYQPCELFKDISTNEQPKVILDKLDLQDKLVTDDLKTPYHEVGFKMINSVSDQDSMVDVVSIDPFDLCDSNLLFEIPSRVATLYQPNMKFTKPVKDDDESQVATELKSFLENQDRRTSSIMQTQVVSKIDEPIILSPKNNSSDYQCECGSHKPLQSIEFRKLQCPACHKNKHASCYGYELTLRNVPKDFKCFTCRSKEHNKEIHSELPILMNVRKIYRIVQKTDIPESINTLTRDLGYDRDQTVQCQWLIKAFTVLIHDGILKICERPIQKIGNSKKGMANGFMIGSDYIQIDVPGIYDGSKEIPMTQIAMCFTPSTSRYRRKTEDDFTEIVQERKNFYFNETLEFWYDENESPTQFSMAQTIESDPILDNSQMDLFEKLEISKKRSFEEEIITPIKSRKISAVKKDLII